ncbi:MAG: peptidoglycan-binding protein [Clostridia bacterium]|nr:peptidoglycan-binding protein [Clostridia bacterium]
MKKFLSVLLLIMLFFTIIPAQPLQAASNIIINGVDIGYAVGDYFTKNGKSCATGSFSNGTCHGHGICVNNTDSRCNCLRYWPSKSNMKVDLGATQCFGFTRFCQWKLYGYHDGNAPSKFKNLTGSIAASGCTASTLKSKLLGCAFATHIRTHDGHSMSVIATSNTNIKIVSCNMKVNGVKVCKIYSKDYTWDSFATYLKGRSGISYAKAFIGGESSYKGSSTVTTPNYSSINPDDYTYPSRTLKYTSPTMKGNDVKWVQAVLCRLGYSLDIDGSYGKNSVAAIKQFQSKYGLTVDGYCGPATRAKLLELWNAKKTTHTHTVVHPTCTKPMHCSTCGVTAGSALGHIYNNSCDTSCERCGATRRASHNYKTTVTKATLATNGRWVDQCVVCGHVYNSFNVYRPVSFKLSTTTYTYNGKVKTPSVTVKDSAGKTLKKNTDYTVSYVSGRKNVGTYKVTIKMKGKYSGTKTLTFKINPAGTTVSKFTAGKKSITVNISKKSTQVSGYQVQYSTSKKFTSAKTKTISSYKTTKYTLKSLSAKKTYYVRVRTYRTVSGKKYYSGWSTVKSVKTK